GFVVAEKLTARGGVDEITKQDGDRCGERLAKIVLFPHHLRILPNKRHSHIGADATSAGHQERLASEPRFVYQERRPFMRRESRAEGRSTEDAAGRANRLARRRTTRRRAIAALGAVVVVAIGAVVALLVASGTTSGETASGHSTTPTSASDPAHSDTNHSP